MKITQLIAFLPWLFTQIPAYSSGPWSMQSCVRHALEHSHDLKIQTWNIKSQKTNLTEAYTAFLPSLSAGSGLSYSFGRSVDPGTNTYSTVSNLNNNYSASLSLPLFKGGILVHQLKISRLQLALGKSQLEAQKDQTALNVMNAFTEAVYYDMMTEYADEKLEESHLQMQKTRRMAELGMKSQSDVALIEAQLAQDEYDHTHSLYLKEKALLTLKELMNYPAESALVLLRPQMQTADTDTVSSPDIAEETIQSFRWSEAHNPGMKQSRLNIQQKLYYRRQALGYFFPSISFSAGISTSYFRTLGESGYDSFRQQARNNLGEYISFNVSMPIFNRLGNAMNYRRKKIEYYIAEENHAQQQTTLWTDIRQTILERESLRKECVRMQKKVEADSIAYMVVAHKFDEGLAAPLDLKTAAASLLSSRSTLLQCRLNFILRQRLAAYYQGEPLY